MHPENPNVAMNIIAAYDQLGREKLAEGAAARGAIHHIRTGHRVAGGEQEPTVGDSKGDEARPGRA